MRQLTSKYSRCNVINAAYNHSKGIQYLKSFPQIEIQTTRLIIVKLNFTANFVKLFRTVSFWKFIKLRLHGKSTYQNAAAAREIIQLNCQNCQFN